MTATRLSKIKVKLQMIMEIKRKCNIMKKIGLLCATLLASISLSGCNNLASQHSHKASSSSSTKVVKHHHKKQRQRPQSSSTSSSSSTSQTNQQSQSQASSVQSTQPSKSSQPNAWNSQQQAYDQTAQNGGPATEDQARAMLGGANRDLQATRTSNGWTFSGNGYTATINDDGTISHN